MAEVFDDSIYKGMLLEEAMAHVNVVQHDLTRRGMAMGAKAEWLLAGHRHDGHARILVESGDVDRHIILDDSRGLDAAMSIEYGRKGGDDGKGAMRGTYVLHDATGLPR